MLLRNEHRVYKSDPQNYYTKRHSLALSSHMMQADTHQRVVVVPLMDFRCGSDIHRGPFRDQVATVEPRPTGKTSESKGRHHGDREAMTQTEVGRRRRTR